MQPTRRPTPPRPCHWRWRYFLQPAHYCQMPPTTRPWPRHSSRQLLNLCRWKLSSGRLRRHSHLPPWLLRRLQLSNHQGPRHAPRSPPPTNLMRPTLRLTPMSPNSWPWNFGQVPPSRRLWHWHRRRQQMQTCQATRRYHQARLRTYRQHWHCDRQRVHSIGLKWRPDLQRQSPVLRHWPTSRLPQRDRPRHWPRRRCSPTRCLTR